MARTRRPIRPLRLAFGLAAAASAVLCLAIGAAWVRSFWVQDYVSTARAGGRYLLIVSGSGSVVIERAWGWPADQPLRHGAQPVGGMNTFAPAVAVVSNSAGTMRDGPGVWRVSGFGWVSTPERRALSSAVPPVPFDVVRLWWGVPFALTAALPTAWLLGAGWRWRRRRRWSEAGKCRQCGYDLRATPVGPEQGGALLDRCPECGTAASAGQMA